MRMLVDSLNPTGLPQVLEERGTAGDLQASYTYGLDLLAMSRGNVDRFYQYDAHGSTRQLTDAAGLVTDTYAYEGYGDLAAHTGATPNPYLFAGERFDAGTAFYGLRARQYDPSAGRFVSRDPVEGSVNDPRSRHPYAYAHGDPVNLIDPTGKSTLLELGIISGIENVLKGLDIAQRAGTACTFIGKAKALGAGVFLAAIAIGLAYGNEELQGISLGPSFGTQTPSGAVDLFAIENPVVPKEGGFKSFGWSVSYRLGQSPEQLFDFTLAPEVWIGSQCSPDVQHGHRRRDRQWRCRVLIKGPKYSACGIDIVTTNILAIVQQSFGQNGFGSGSFRLLGQLKMLGLLGFSYQLMSIP